MIDLDDIEWVNERTPDRTYCALCCGKGMYLTLEEFGALADAGAPIDKDSTDA